MDLSRRSRRSPRRCPHHDRRHPTADVRRRPRAVADRRPAGRRATTERARRQRSPTSRASGQPGKDVVWVPTPPSLVELMLDMAKVTKDDFVMDIGLRRRAQHHRRRQARGPRRGRGVQPRHGRTLDEAGPRGWRRRPSHVRARRHVRGRHFEGQRHGDLPAHDEHGKVDAVVQEPGARQPHRVEHVRLQRMGSRCARQREGRLVLELVRVAALDRAGPGRRHMGNRLRACSR